MALVVLKRMDQLLDKEGIQGGWWEWLTGGKTDGTSNGESTDGQGNVSHVPKQGEIDPMYNGLSALWGLKFTMERLKTLCEILFGNDDEILEVNENCVKITCPMGTPVQNPDASECWINIIRTLDMKSDKNPNDSRIRVSFTFKHRDHIGSTVNDKELIKLMCQNFIKDKIRREKLINELEKLP